MKRIKIAVHFFIERFVKYIFLTDLSLYPSPREGQFGIFYEANCCRSTASALKINQKSGNNMFYLIIAAFICPKGFQPHYGYAEC
jgi:hypothetical protein